MKADDKVKYPMSEDPEKFTNFEELAMKVKVLAEALDEHAGILRENDLVIECTKEAPYFDEDEVYDRLEG